MSERATIRAAQRGSPDAVEKLVRAYWPDAQRIAVGVTGDVGAAEDVAQESMLAAVRSLGDFDRRRPFRPWLHRIVVNRSLDWLRARNRRAEVELDSAFEHASTNGAGPPGNKAISDELTALLLTLEPRDRAVVVLRHLLDLNSREVAEILDMPEGTVRSSLSRSLQRLRDRLEEEPSNV
jgi:RNA polymerase sigma-70 factor (ECF subfamily)